MRAITGCRAAHELMHAAPSCQLGEADVVCTVLPHLSALSAWVHANYSGILNVATYTAS